MLEVSYVTKMYGKTVACNDVTFTLPDGGITVLLGPNGAGKSTLIKSIIGFLRYGGTIAVDGKLNKTIEAKRILGYVPEMPSLYPNLTVSEHMEFVARAYRLTDYKGYAEQLLDRFELTDKKKKFGAGILSSEEDIKKAKEMGADFYFTDEAALAADIE